MTAVSANVDDILESVRDILVKVELLTRGQERLAIAVSSIQGSVVVGLKDIMDGLKQMSVGVEGGVPAANVQQAEILARVQSVKRAFRARIMKRMAEATRSSDVYLDTGRTWSELTSVGSEALGEEPEAATEWLLSTIRLPARRDTSVLVSMRACVPILRAKPHLMQTLKEIVCSAFFTGICQPRDNLSEDTAKLWLTDLAYMQSERGYPCLLVGLTGLLRNIGASHMVVEATSFGGCPTIHTTTGHFSLASCFVRAALESKAVLRSRRRSGVGEGIFDIWKAELARVDAVLPHDDAVHSGLRLIDGHDVNRAVVIETGQRGAVPDVNDDLAYEFNDGAVAAGGTGTGGGAASEAGGSVMGSGDDGGSAAAGSQGI